MGPNQGFVVISGGSKCGGSSVQKKRKPTKEKAQWGRRAEDLPNLMKHSLRWKSIIIVKCDAPRKMRERVQKAHFTTSSSLTRDGKGNTNICYTNNNMTFSREDEMKKEYR